VGTKQLTKDGLSDNDRYFVHQYLSLDRVGKAAWKVVHPNASEKTCEVEASKCLGKPKIQAYLLELEKEQFKEIGISRKNTLRGLSRVGYMLNYTPRKDLKKDIKEIGTQVVSALDKLAKAQKIYQPEVELNIETEGDVYTGPILMLPAKKAV
jgi:hypothetical protein